MKEGQPKKYMTMKLNLYIHFKALKEQFVVCYFTKQYYNDRNELNKPLP